MSLRRIGLVLVALVLVAACRDEVEDEATPTSSPSTTATTATTVTASVPDFDGDPDSAFCELRRGAADRPVRDPFAPGLAPREVELRFRALASRFRAFEEVSPPALEEDLDTLVAIFDELAELLEAAEYDFARLAEADVDLSVFDDDRLARIADRLAAYERQVCAAD